MTIQWVGKNRRDDLNSKLNITAIWQGDRIEKVIICLHGFGDNAKNFSHISNELNLKNTVFLNVEAPKPVPMSFDGFQWYPLFSNPLQELRHSTAQIMQLMADVENQWDIKSEKQYLLGFSQGGSMALHCFMKKQRRMGGVFVLSGFYLKLEEPDGEMPVEMLETPVFISHGTQDQVVFPVALYETQSILKKRGIKKIITEQYPSGHQITPPVIQKMKAVFAGES